MKKKSLKIYICIKYFVILYPVMARVSSYSTNHDFLNWGGQLLTNLKIDTYEGTPSNINAASAPEVAFFVCANPKNSIAMIKNNFNELGTYVSPAIKVAQLNPRRVMCQSTQLRYGENPGVPGMMLDDNSYDEEF